MRRTIHDVFISFNSQDAPQAALLVDLLAQQGLSCWWDRQQLKPGDRLHPEIENAMNLSRSALILWGEKGLGRYQREELYLAFNIRMHDASFRLIQVALPDGKVPPSSFASTDAYIIFSHQLNEQPAFDNLISALSGEPLPNPLEIDLPSEPAPYMGLKPFAKGSSRFFLGRDQEISDALALLDRQAFLAVLGESGSGKTSLIHAGLLPRLPETGDGTGWTSIMMTPGREPVLNLARALGRLSPSRISLFRRTRQIHDEILRSTTLTNVVSALVPQDRHVVLVVDRLEEIFLENSEIADEERRRFLTLLASTHVEEEPTVWVIAVLRAEFYGRLPSYPDFFGKVKANHLALGPLSEESLIEVIERPLTLVGAVFEKGLSRRIKADAEMQGGVFLPFLSNALRMLWDRREKRILTSRAYEEIGGVRGALEAHADNVIRGLTEFEREIAVVLLTSLTWIDKRTRRVIGRRLEVEELLDRFPGRRREAERVLSLLQKGRLVSGAVELVDVGSSDQASRSYSTGSALIGLSHDSLAEHWGKLRTWIDRDREFLLWLGRIESRLVEWDQGGDKAKNLLEGRNLEEAEEWLAERPDLLPQVVEFVQSSISRREFLSALKIVLLTIFVSVAFALGVFGKIAYSQSRTALSRALSAEALTHEKGPLDRGLLLSLQAYEVEKTIEARGSLMRLLGQTAQLRYILPLHKGTVHAAKPSPDGTILATGDLEGIRLWSLETGEPLSVPLGGDAQDESSVGGNTLSLAFHPRRPIIAGSREGRAEIRIWDYHTGRSMRTITSFADVENLSFSPDGKWLAGSSGDKVLLFDYKGGRFAKESVRHNSWVTDLAFSRGTRRLASAGYAGTIVIQSVDDLNEKISMNPGGPVLALSFSPDGRVLASAGKAIRLWDARSGQSLGEACLPDVGEDFVTSVAFDPSGQYLASAGLDRQVRIWDVSNPKACRFFSAHIGHGATIWNVAFGAGYDLISSGDRGEVMVWAPHAESRLSHQLGVQRGELRSIQLSSDGQILAASDGSGEIQLYGPDPNGGGWPWAKLLGKLPSMHGGSANQVAFSPLDGQLASGGRDGRVLLWDPSSLRLKRELRAPTKADPVKSLRFSPDGKFIAAGTKEGRLIVWDIMSDDDRPISRREHHGAIYSVAFDPEGRRLVSSGEDRSLILWRFPALEPISSVLNAHAQPVASVAFQNTGELIASGGLDRTVRFWLVRSKLEPIGAAFTAPSVTSLAFSRDGQVLAAGGYDGEIALWDMKSRRFIGSGFRRSGRVASVTFDPSGDFLFAGAGDRLLAWDLRYESWRSQACSLLRRDASESELFEYPGLIPYRSACKR